MTRIVAGIVVVGPRIVPRLRRCRGCPKTAKAGRNLVWIGRSAWLRQVAATVGMVETTPATLDTECPRPPSSLRPCTKARRPATCH